MNKHIDNINIHYTDEGSGTILVLLHGWGMNHSYFDDFRKYMDVMGDYRWISIDLPGFGQSSEPPQDWGIDEYANSITSLLKSITDEEIILLGHSFGGQIATHIAGETELSIRGLILCGASSIRDTQIASNNSGWKRLLKNNVILKPLRELYIQLSGSSDYAKASPVMRNVMKKILKQDQADMAKKILAPTLLVWGARDTYTPIEQAHELHALIPQSTLAIRDDIGHSLPRQKPQWLAKHVHAFLNSL